jgi:hypothetical protein
MSVNGSFVDITLDDFRAMGNRFEVPGIRETLAEVADAIDQWRDFASTARVNPDTTERIASDLREMRPT